jgi:hypothetical protein
METSSKYNLNERRDVKWNRLMPEHVEMLRDFYEEVIKMPRPQLDEWDLHAIEETRVAKYGGMEKLNWMSTL